VDAVRWTWTCPDVDADLLSSDLYFDKADKKSFTVSILAKTFLRNFVISSCVPSPQPPNERHSLAIEGTAVTQITPQHPLALRPADLAARLNISPRHVTNLRKHPDPVRRLPPACKVGRMVFWRTTEIEAWLDRQGRTEAGA
jgi:predicted DNA-binding transcriptional regulator AlpA